MSLHFETFKKDFKRDLLIKIVVSMKHGKMDQAQSRELAKQVFGIFRANEAENVFSKINKLAETYPEILDIFIKRMGEFENRDKDDRLNKIMIILKPEGGEN